MKNRWTLTLPEDLYRSLHQHLFPGDADEHGAVILAGMAQGRDGPRLLAREVHLAQDGVDYVPGQRGYRMLKAEFIRDHMLAARNQRLVYLAIHNHGGTNRVSFSGDDLRSHERGYPALLDIARGMPVGALVFAEQAVAGDIWLPQGTRVALSSATVVGGRFERLAPSPRVGLQGHALIYDRQARLLGDLGNQLLSELKVGIIGAGGVGSLLVEFLARLGVGSLVTADPDRIDLTNLPRLVGATRRDAMWPLTAEGSPEWLRRLGKRLATTKVALAERLARQANRGVIFEGILGDISDHEVASRFLGCDYLFLAADSMQARLVFNAIVHQYLIPGVQLGCKAVVDKKTGQIDQVYSVVRPINPDSGCLWCGQLISPSKLQQEAETEYERRVQRYVDDPDIEAPSVITLNAVSAAHAANDFLFAVTGLTRPHAEDAFLRYLPLERKSVWDEAIRYAACSECGSGPSSRRARGDATPLPTRPPRQKQRRRTRLSSQIPNRNSE